MILTVSVLCLVCVAIGWLARGLRSPRRDAVYSYESAPGPWKIKAGNLTEDELQRFIASFEKSMRHSGPTAVDETDEVQIRLSPGVLPDIPPSMDTPQGRDLLRKLNEHQPPWERGDDRV